MKRPRFLLALAALSCALVLGGCRQRPTPLPDLFTEVVGVWRRTSIGDLPPSQTYGPVPPGSIERIRAATYEGPGKLDARVFQLTSPEVAYDVAQQWRPNPDTVFFYNDRFFVVVQWQTADRKALQEFVRILEKKFPARQ
jgi:hypothetical protein